MGQSGQGKRDPCGTSGEGLAVRQDRTARASARAARAGEACDMDSRGSVPDLESSTDLGLREKIEEKNCDLANEENRSNEKDPAQQIADANAEKHSQERISASETFWQEAFEMERQKNSWGETSDQGRRSSDEALLPAGTKDALEEKENEVREFIPRSESSGGGSQAPKPPCKGFMQKCKEMVAGYLAPSTSSTRNDHPGPEENENQEGVAANDP